MLQANTIKASESGSLNRGSHALIAIAITLVFLISYYARMQNWPFGWDNDNYMRLVQIRDFLAGQDWFDHSQYRMGPEGGFVMHWSRIVDLPIAMLIMAGQFVSGSVTSGEIFAAIAWPALLFAVAVFVTVRVAKGIGGEHAILPAFVLSSITLYSTGLFAPGSFDHHNLQLVLILVAIMGLVVVSGWRGGAMGGSAAAASLATGLETMPIVAALGLSVSIVWLMDGKSFGHMAVAFGGSFALAALAAFVSTIDLEYWFLARCDEFSFAQLSISVLAGAALAAAAATPFISERQSFRAAALLMIAGATAATILVAFPHCLAQPYSGLDPRLQSNWLSGVSEAQPITKLIVTDLSLTARFYVTPLLALAALFLISVRKADQIVLALILAFAILTSMWQVRGAMFSVPLAVIPLAIMLGSVRRSVEKNPRFGSQLLVAVLWLISFNQTWTTATALFTRTTTPDQAIGVADNDCSTVADFAGLATMQASTVAAISNLGAPILALTPHHVLAGPYHRNVGGNLTNLEILSSKPDGSRKLVEKAGIQLVVHCPGNTESHFLARRYPESLIAMLMSDAEPEWLTRTNQTENSALAIFQVRSPPIN